MQAISMPLVEAEPAKKRCTRCGLERPLTYFHRRGKRGYQVWCKTCRSEYDHDHWAADSERQLAIRRARKRGLAVWLWEMKRGKPCADCGQSFHPVAMHWDHTGTDKVINISRAVNHGWTRERILLELAKCELVCSNCHSIRTYTRKRQTDPSDEECYSYLRDVAQLGLERLVRGQEGAGSNPAIPTSYSGA